ncbi:MAG TPA: efflux RND transporter periplasmic adaptor subunit [Spirochaetota bacterium]|nr:efflux RND transporter periplasmic adaptor subunit [Spirochaetota bacterium]
MQKPGLKIITIAVIAALVIIIIFIFKSCSNSGDKIFVYEKAAAGEVKKTISVTGELDIMNPSLILSKTSGVIENIYTDFNQNVSKGALLIKLEGSAVEQKIMKAQGTVDTVKFEIKSAERELEGKKNLYKDNLISKKAMEQAEIEYNAVLNKYKQVKLDYDMAVQERNFTRIHSPISGIVIAVYVKKNSPIGISTPLILLAPSLSKMILTISIDESDIGNIKTGQQVIFSVSAFPDKKFKGIINQVRMNPVKSGGLVTYQALVVCENNELLLKPGMTATATVVIDQKDNVLRVLNQAFLISPETDSTPENGKKYIWKKTGIGTAKSYKRIEVKTGLSGDMHTEIIDGIKDGDEVMIKIQESK